MLTKEGESMVANGTPEFQIYQLLPEEGMSMKDLKSGHKQLARNGVKNGMKRYFKMDKGNLVRLENAPQNDVDRDLLTAY